MKKKTYVDYLKLLTKARTERLPRPRSTVFVDKTKYDRNRQKEYDDECEFLWYIDDENEEDFD